MIFAGIKLMIIGMSTVMVFLVLMIVSIGLVAHLTKDFAAKELEAIRLEREARALKAKQKKLAAQANELPLAVIAAAVAAYEADTRS